MYILYNTRDSGSDLIFESYIYFTKFYHGIVIGVWLLFLDLKTFSKDWINFMIFK